MPKALADQKAPSGTRNARSVVFEKEFAKLNPQQRHAVDAIEGPVMVVAGPGTGKTQVVAMRVANILTKTHMRPANILCLTYSVSGATAMRDRLRQLIGPDAYGVTVSTIHAFAASIIEQNAFLFEEWSAKEQLSDIEKYRELNTIIDQTSSHSNLINQKDPYAKDSDLLSRISQVKREGKSVEDLEKAADAFEAQMTGKSKAGTKANEKNLLAVKKFRDFVGIFRAYQEMLARTGRYDYDDMILHVIRALQEEDWLLQNLQERFQYVLVDEFQDTNGAQYRLIELLTTYKDLPVAPNIFVVGDDDQAIYRFQGANLLNMLSFHKRFPQAPVIPLTVSYRSTQAILDAAASLIKRNEERLVGKIPGLEKTLTAASRLAGDAPTLLRPPSDIAEPWMIADIIEMKVEKGLPPDAIAVLTQTNAELQPIYDVLRARDIPVLLRGKDDLLSHPLVAQAMAVLRAVEQPLNDAKLASALACDCFDIHTADLSRLQLSAREKKQRLHDVLLGAESDQELKLLYPEKVIHARDTIDRLHQKLAVRTVLETVEHVLRQCGIVPVPQTASDPIDPRALAAVESFFSYVKSRGLERRSMSLHDLLSDLHFYADPQYGQARLTYELPHLSTSGVRLMTAHQSKGLEFDTVILTNFRDGHWDKRRRPSGVAIPEDLLFGWEKDQKTFEQHQDERRVAFVAMTRARRELIFSCPKELTVGEKTRSVSPSAFFAEAGECAEQDAALSDPKAASLLLHPAAPVLDKALEAYLRERLETFALSATSLNRFLTDPKEFLRIDLLGLPEQFDEGMARRIGYGKAVHWALKEWAVARNDGKEFDAAKLLDAFNWYLRERTILTDKQREDLIALGAQSLPRYFEQRLKDHSAHVHAIERAYRTRLGDIPLKGTMDRIDVESATSAHATVIDYKAGQGKTEGDIRGPAEAGTISRGKEGNQFRQLAFYAVLLERAEPLLEPKSFVLEYVGERGEHPVTRAFVIADSEKSDLHKLVKDVWAKVTALDFTSL